MGSNSDLEFIAKYERETWSRCAESYVDTFAGITNEAVPRLIETGNIGPDCHVLEIGCGPGNAAEMMQNAGARVLGVDFSEEMVEVARKRFPDITFEQANAEELPYEPDSFDVVVANFVVHHLARPEVVFTEVHRVLKSGGKFVFAVWGPKEEQSSIGAFVNAVMTHHELADLPHGPLFGVTQQDVFAPFLASAGLVDCQLSIEPLQWKTDTLDPVIKGFWDWANMAALPQDMQDKIKQSTYENAKPYKYNGGYLFPHPILFGRAVKD